MLRHLQSWIDRLRWQPLRPFQKLPFVLLDYLEGILNYGQTKVPLGVIEPVNTNLKALLRRSRGHKNHLYLLLKAQRVSSDQNQIPTPQESCVKCSLCRIPSPS